MTFLDLVLTNLSEFVTQTLGSKTFFRLISSGDELCAAASLGWGQPTPQWQHIVSAGVSKSVITITNMIQIHKCVLRDFCPITVCFINMMVCM